MQRQPKWQQLLDDFSVEKESRRSLSSNQSNKSQLFIDDLIKSYFDKKVTNEPNPELETIKYKLYSLLSIFDECSDQKKSIPQEKVNLLKNMMNTIFQKYQTKNPSLTKLFELKLQRILLQQNKEYTNSKLDFHSLKILQEPSKLQFNSTPPLSTHNQQAVLKTNQSNAIKTLMRRLEAIKRISLLKYFYVVKNQQAIIKTQYQHTSVKKMASIIDKIIQRNYSNVFNQLDQYQSSKQLENVEMFGTLDEIYSFQKQPYNQSIIEEQNESYRSIIQCDLKKEQKQKQTELQLVKYYFNYKPDRVKTESDVSKNQPTAKNSTNTRSSINKSIMSRESYRSEGRGRYQSAYSQNKTPKQQLKEKNMNARIGENLVQNDYQLMNPNRKKMGVESPEEQQVSGKDTSPIASPTSDPCAPQKFLKSKRSQEIVFVKSDTKRLNKTKILSDFTNLDESKLKLDSQSNNLSHLLQKTKVSKRLQIASRNCPIQITQRLEKEYKRMLKENQSVKN